MIPLRVLLALLVIKGIYTRDEATAILTQLSWQIVPTTFDKVLNQIQSALK